MSLLYRDEYSAGTLGAALTTALRRSPGYGFGAIATSAPREDPQARRLFLAQNEMCKYSRSEDDAFAMPWEPGLSIEVSGAGEHLFVVQAWRIRDGDAGTGSVPIELPYQVEFLVSGRQVSAQSSLRKSHGSSKPVIPLQGRS